jgi:hypothetical protein
MNRSLALHLYKAGARLARSGGPNRRTLDRWISVNRLYGHSAEFVRRGYRDELALCRALGFDRRGRLGRAA